MTPSLDHLGLVLQQLRRDLDRVLERLDAAPGLAAVERSRAFLERYLADLDAQLERHSHCAVITLVGATGAGKSTLLNALAGAEIAQPGTSRPTTTTPVIFRPRGADVRELIDAVGGADAVRVVESTHARLAEHVLIDAPDTNSHAREHHRTVARLAENSDVLVVVAHRSSIAELMSAEFVDRFAGRRHLCFVLNRADELDAASRAKLIEQLTEFAHERWGVEGALVVATSAKDAAEGAPDDGFRTLEQHIESLVAGGNLGRIRRANALGTCERLAGWARELRAALAAQAGADDAFAALTHQVDVGLEALEAALIDELEKRLALHTRDIELLLWNETARRWQGPGGLALRSGGLTGLGLGAGALVARRSPWLAAGAAAGSMLVDRAQNAVRERRVERGHGLIPTHHELEGLYRGSFGGARLLAQELSGDAGGLGLPTSAEVADSAHAAVESVWARFLERDLPAAGKRGASVLLRLLVDGPVYLLLIWLVLQALVGLLPSAWTSSLFGPEVKLDALTTDRLINTAIVLFAWLLAARALVRMLLARDAAALTRGVAQDAQRELAGLTERLAEPTRAELAGRAAALGQLESLAADWESRLEAEA